MKSNVIKYISVFCLISLILTPVFLISCFLFSSNWGELCYSNFEVIISIFYFGSFLFPFLFIYQLILKKKDFAFKISKISIILFVLELIAILFYLYLLSRIINE